MSLPSLDRCTSTLANGLRVVTVRLPHLQSAVVDVHVRVGSRFESSRLNGISHFLEHMLYRGTPRHPSAHSQALGFENLGGTLDAGTSLDHGSMVVSIPQANLAETLRLVSEVYQEPLLREIQIERGIVREEILESLDERGRVIDTEWLLGQLMFGDHPLGFPITGAVEQLERFDEAMLRAHREQFYVGSATVVSVAGPIDHDAVHRQVEALFSPVTTGTRPSCAPPEPPSAPRVRYVRHTLSQTALRVAFRAPPEIAADEPAMELLLRVLDDGLSTRLYHRLCDQLGLCYDVSAGYEAYEDCGLVEFAAETGHDQVLEVLGEILGIVARLRDEGPTEAELERAKARHRWQLADTFDDPETMAEYFAIGELSGVPQTLLEREQQISEMTRERVVAASRRWWTRESLAIVAVGKLGRGQREQLDAVAGEFS